MAWPNSRLTTYAANSKIKSSDLNAIQDAIIGCKHKELEKGIHNASMVAGNGTPTFDGTLWLSGSAFIMYAPILGIPVGDRITRVRFGYIRNGGTVAVSLIRQALGASSATVVATFSDTTTSGAIIKEIAAINHTVLTDMAYALKYDFNAGAASSSSAPEGGSVYHDNV